MKKDIYLRIVGRSKGTMEGLNFKKHFKKSKFFIMFFISYLLLMFITIVIGGISYIFAIQTVRTSVEEYNLAMVHQATSIIDEKLFTIERAALDIAYNNITNVISNIENINSGENLFAVSQLITEMRNKKNINGFIKGIFVFFSNSNIIVSDEGMFKPISYFQDIIPHKEITFNQWESLFNKEVYRGYRSAQLLKNGGNEVITFQQPVEIYRRDKSIGSVVVMLDKNYLSMLMKNITTLKEGGVLVYDVNNVLIMSIGNTELFKEFDLNRLTFKNTVEVKTKKSNIVISKIISDSTGWQYITATPISIYYEKAGNVKKIVLIITLAQLLFGCLVALLMSRRNYKPIRLSVEKLKNLFGLHESIGEGEYLNFIEHVTSNTLKENEKIKEEMSKAQPVLRDSLINDLLKGTFYLNEDISISFGTVGVEFESGTFIVSKIHVDDCSKFTDEASIQRFALIKLVITNSLEDLCNKKFRIYSINMEKEDVVIIINAISSINTVDESDIDIQYSRILEIMTELQNVIADKFFIFTSIGVSSAFSNINDIPVAFNEAENALSYCVLRGVGSLIKYSKIEHTSYNYEYNINTEIQLINFIKSGDIEKVNKILNDIYNKSFSTSNQSLEVARCMLYDMVCTVIKVMDELHVDEKDIWGVESDIINELLKIKNIQEMNVRLKNKCISLCEYINSHKKSHNVELKEKLIAYIQNNYNSNHISLISLSESLGLNATYVSWFFKEQTGETFSNYLAKLRIEKSKNLLEKDLTLQDIAENVGYTNSGVFIKTFKKYEGFTPGKFREFIRNPSNNGENSD